MKEWPMKLAVAFPLSVALLAAGSLVLCAQTPQPNSAAAQREAMQKIAFLAGHWSGPVKVVAGPGEPLHLTQTEDVTYKLDGLVLLVEGASRDSSGKVLFSALATVAFDDASHAYRIRAYNDGHYVDTEFTSLPKGFSWAFTSGPAHIANVMHLTDKGEWAETTDATVGNNPPHRGVDMLLERRP
jgi:hypothetical protein